MEAARLRHQQAALDFNSHYETLCALQSTCPIASVRTGAKNGVLNCQVYRLNRSDWKPILTALSVNRALHTLVFNDKWKEKAYTQLKGACRERLPLSSRISQVVSVTADKETTCEIVQAVKQCMTVSSAVRSLVLEGVQLRPRDMRCLMKGLEVCMSLQHISLKGSKCGDECIEVLCRGLRHCGSHVDWLDLTCCDLTSTGVASVTALIRYHCLSRRRCAWEKSLRGGCHPRLGLMAGLHRVTLNLNPLIGDDGVLELAGVLQDDLWIKAVDLQSCSLTMAAVNGLLDMLQSNTTLTVLDLRANQSIDFNALGSIHEQLAVNLAAASEEPYPWLDIEVAVIEAELRRSGLTTKPRRPRRPIKRVSTARSTSASDAVVLSEVKRQPGMPWRTAARSMHRINQSSNSMIQSQLRSDHGRQEEEERTEEDSEDEEVVSPMRVTVSQSLTSCADESSTVQLTEDQFRELQHEIATCHHKLREEKNAVMKLEAENKELKDRVAHLEAKLASRETLSSIPDPYKDLNAQTLTAIETTFQQFHAFLDLLNEKGCGGDLTEHFDNITSIKMNN